MKQLINISVLAILIYSLPSFSASQDECAIWLCLPGGFPAGCAAAHAAMISRLKDFKPPLPSFSSCSINSGSLSASYGSARYIPAHTKCIASTHIAGYCSEYIDVPAKLEKGICPSNSISSDQTPCHPRKFIEVLDNGDKLGNTYFF